MIYSFSRLKLYDTCPMQFRLKYLDNLEEKASMPLALGKAVHKGIELKIHGVPHSEAVLNGWAEADFHPEVSYQDISRLVNNAPI
ncbi:MAG TPA: PD-(D/E)XK nuclease family protein, partial [Paenibacillaceae bacterium]|nr:PD-(D/E)XK nuclease family protein [Paenibacillaceae bacterium]